MAQYSSEDLRRLDVLGRIIVAAAAQETNSQDLLGTQPNRAEADYVRERVRELESAELLNVDWRFNGGWSARPTARGRDAWSAFKAARNDVRARRRRMRDEYIVWVVDQDDAGSSPTVDDFTPTGANYLGMPYTQEDLEQTGKWLSESRYIKGPGAWGRADPIRPETTAKGLWTVEGGKSVDEPTNDEAPAAATFTNYFHAPANVAQNSQHVQQTINISWQDQARELVDEIAGRLENVEDDHARAELAAAAELRRNRRAGPSERRPWHRDEARSCDHDGDGR
ncbi:hypothetical protein [Curtobacterium sp. Leaf261]|uniref:hypothetical protein n=1 Tax=Curtobacterium sp. Leaf261 TaxID=1736311 RepID=UPI0006FFD188|nr:hypothetical protein [Curtobacterium sp. Leaf261]KQO64207.1 hypothetical protein ASF23_16725 [Curtobacterium sp. Leaf261]